MKKPGTHCGGEEHRYHDKWEWMTCDEAPIRLKETGDGPLYAIESHPNLKKTTTTTNPKTKTFKTSKQRS